MEKRENIVSVWAGDSMQLTQDQITARWMGPDGPVSLTKGSTVSALQKGDIFPPATLERKRGRGRLFTISTQML